MISKTPLTPSPLPKERELVLAGTAALRLAVVSSHVESPAFDYARITPLGRLKTWRLLLPLPPPRNPPFARLSTPPVCR